ncbi:unnamed protein product [Rotaria socialis]|uniref:ABC transporter domain-containing protein n=1 Tax=Rotaria socialis TaxID=392032 RepID=A0A818SSW2_9BILA|nr:unnamed protein product [Rotaria socialis]
MLFLHQLKVLLWKNYILKKRSPFVLLFELFIPLVLFLVMTAIRKTQEASFHPQTNYTSNFLDQTYRATPFPSSGVFSILQSFCPKTAPSNEQGFSIFPNGTSTEMLITIDRITRTNPFFTQNFSMFDIDSLPDMYETLIDRPAFVYDSLSNLTFSFTKNLTKICSFFIMELNYSKEECELIFNKTVINTNQIQNVFPHLFGNLSDGSQNDTEDNLNLIEYYSLLQISLSPDEFSAVTQLFGKILATNSFENLTKAELHLLAKAIKITFFHRETLKKVFCSKEKFNLIYQFNSTAINKTDFQQRLCNMSDEQYQELSNLLMNSISDDEIIDAFQLEHIEISSMLFQLDDYVIQLEKYAAFEQGLRDLYDIAKLLRTNSCSIDEHNNTETSTSSRPAVTFTGNVESVAMNKLKTKKGFFPLWLGMQEAICGIRPKTNLNSDQQLNGDQLPDLAELGISDNQQRQLGLLFYVLYGNSLVLYAPNSTLIDGVISKANSTFVLLDTITKYAFEWRNVSNVLKTYFLANGTDKKVDSLRRMKKIVEEFGPSIHLSSMDKIVKILKNLSDPSIDNYMKQITTIDKAACSWISLISGINLNVYKGFANENDLVEYFLRRAYHDNYTVIASVVFTNVRFNDTELPPNTVYKIRQNASLTPSTKRVRDRFWVPAPAQSGFLYYDFGFSWVQEVIDRAIIDTQVGRPVIEPGLFFQEMSYPCYTYDKDMKIFSFLQMIQHALPLCLTISWVYAFAMLTQSIVYEKEVRLKEVMKIMGLSNGVHWIAWFITIFSQTTVVMIAVTIILHYGKVLLHSNAFLIFLIFEIYALSTISLAFLVSVFYSKAKIAAACSGIIYLLTYVPCMYISIREDLAQDTIPKWAKMLASLFSTSAFGMGAKYIAFYENIGTGIQFDNIRYSPVEGDSFTCFETVLFMIFDTLIHLILMWYIENVYPGTYGIPKKWYFPFTISYWTGETCVEPDWIKKFKRISLFKWFTCRKHHMSYQFHWSSSSLNPITNDSNRNEDYFERDDHLNSQTIGVRLTNLTKIFDRKKCAVQNLSMDLYEGEILSFLGHNGAGKTTTMSILTGLIPATSGTATIYDQDINIDMDKIRKNLGWCPQHNVLFEKLTVEEHLLFFSKLKQVQSKEMKKMIENMLFDVGLTSKRNATVSTLSGGMKRKLSVAMAFVGDAKTIILDEPTAGVDPYARRAIWELLLKLKRGRTILLSSHHMDEADVLGDRIAIISNGQLKCCGTSLFLKTTFGEGYVFTLVKNDPWTSSRNEVTSTITQCIPKAYLKEETRKELKYVLPLKSRPLFPEFFSLLDSRKESLSIAGYGLQDVSLEEVFLKVTEQYKSSPNAADVEAEFNNNSTNESSMEISTSTSGSTISKSNISYDRVTGARLYAKQALSIIIKRFIFNYRNLRGLATQILLPAFFITVAMTVALTAPGFADPPPIILSTAMFSHLNYLYTPVSDLNDYKLRNISHISRLNANPYDLSETIQYPSGIGSTCLLKNPYMNETMLKLDNLVGSLCEKVYQNDFTSYSLSDINWLHMFEDNQTFFNRSYQPDQATINKYYSPCQCLIDQSRFTCPTFPTPEIYRLISNDRIINITKEQNEILYYLYTSDNHHLDRYGGLSFGLEQDYVPNNYPINVDNQILQKLAVKNIARIFTNHKGYHSLPLYINIMSNVILRANLPFEKGLPSAYGITTINHPINETNNMLSTEFILQGSDVVISIFIIVAMSFVPASFTLFLVYERATKSKHIQYINGLYPLVYWLTNFIWDLLNYLLPAACVIVILRLFNVPAYVEGENFLAVISLFLMYGWSIIPVMYPFSFRFTEPSNAYIFLIVINLFSGITCIYTSFFLEIFALGSPATSTLSIITRTVKKIFKIFPNYCLGRGLIDIAYNDYYNSFYKKTGLTDRIRTPFMWDITVSNLVSMAICGLVFWILTLLLEYGFFYSPNVPDALPFSHLDEDEDVAQIRRQVVNKTIDDNILVMSNLSKCYRTKRHKKLIAVNNLCLGIRSGECFGLCGVNGAGKTTTFRMLIGDLYPTAGYAQIHGFDSMKQKRQVFKYIGYCPQFDALFDELTPVEHMSLMARLRGIYWQDENHHVLQLLKRLDLCEYLTVPVGKLSLGNRRKLSTAMALVGDPSVVFLDEPTSGMDPSSRRFLWNVIRRLIKEGKSIILTSHSMEECEVLCSSIAIMVNGCFRCLGSTQHLKNRFGDGYTIKIRLKSASNTTSDQTILDGFSSNFILKERHINILQYEIAEEHVSLKDIFSKLENLLINERITDYSVSQNTLDNVFVNFVRDQYNTTQQTKKPSRRRQEHFDGILDDTFDDGSFIVTKSRRNNNNNNVSLEIPKTTACNCKINTNSLDILDCSKL